MSSRLPSLIVVAVLSLTVTAASAQGPGLVSWEAPDECPTATEVTRRVEQLLGSPEALAGSPVRMRAAVTSSGDGTFVLSLRGERGARELRGESCEVVADAAALIVAMAVDPDAVAETQLDGESAPAVPVERTDAPTPIAASLAAPSPNLLSVSVAAPATAPAAMRAGNVASARTASDVARAAVVEAGDDGASEPLVFGIALGATGDLGALPGASLGPALAGSVETGALRVELRAAILPSREARAGNHATARGDLSLVAAGARACAVALRGGVELGPCAGIEAGAMHATGRGVSAPSSATALWAAADAGGFVAVPLAGPFLLRADVAAVVAVNRPAFVIDGVPGVVHRPSAVGGRLGLSAEARFR